LEYTLGGYGQQIEDIYNFISINKWVDEISEDGIGSTFEGLQLEASNDLDDNLIYIQDSYNIAIHTFTIQVPF